MSEARTPLTFGTVVVVGGGCYGAYYVQQLERAAAAGAVCIDELLVIDRHEDCLVARRTPSPLFERRVVVSEWSAFFARYLAEAAASPGMGARDAIVPSPLMPHLLYRWVVERLRARWPGRDVREAPLHGDLPVPWQRPGDDGTHYASFATWMCPINCIEPVRCPHTRASRDWTMPVALQRHANAERAAGRPLAGPYVFHCTHRAYGVGMIDVAAVVAAEAHIVRQAEGGPLDALIGTVSHCHGAVSRVVVGQVLEP